MDKRDARRPRWVKPAVVLTLAAAALSFGVLTHLHGRQGKGGGDQKDEAGSRAACLEAYKVLMHPRCLNCHPVGDVPLQGDDSHPHSPMVKRGPDGKGKFALKCANCHQEANLPGENMPPGNPNWHLPPPEMRMVFEGKTPRELAEQLKDPRSEEHTSELQSLRHLVCRLLLEKKNQKSDE